MLLPVIPYNNSIFICLAMLAALLVVLAADIIGTRNSTERSTMSTEEQDFNARVLNVQIQHSILGGDGTWNRDPYHHGLFNGVEIALSAFEGRKPECRNQPKGGYLEE